MQMNSNQASKDARQGARTMERIAWVILLLCAGDLILNTGVFSGGLRVFLTALAATLLIIGVVVRKQAAKSEDVFKG